MTVDTDAPPAAVVVTMYDGDTYGDILVNEAAGLIRDQLRRQGIEYSRPRGAGGAEVIVDPFNHIGIFYVEHILNFFEVYRVIHPRVRDLIYKCLFD